MSPPPSPPLKLLLLHGYTQTGSLFSAKTKALQKALHKAFPASPSPGHLPSYPGGVEFHFPTAPIKLSTGDIPGFTPGGEEAAEQEAYGWWRRKDDGGTYVYTGMEEGLATIAETMKTHGPFAGVIGFSQGAAGAALVASLLEPGRREVFEAAEKEGGMAFPASFIADDGKGLVNPPLLFATSFSGFRAPPSRLYDAFYDPPITTPMQHVIGTVDTVVSEERSLLLAKCCEPCEGSVFYHPGGHFLPSSKDVVAALVGFIRAVAGGEKEEKVEEGVEDMDVPF